MQNTSPLKFFMIKESKAKQKKKEKRMKRSMSHIAYLKNVSSDIESWENFDHTSTLERNKI